MKIGIDIDGTISNTIEVTYGAVFGKSVSPSVLGQYNLTSFGADTVFFTNEWVYRKARPYRGAANVLRALLAKGHEVVYITARPPEMRKVTEEWLYRHGFPFAELAIGRVKAEVVREKGIEIMIEDAPHEIEKLEGLTKLIIMDRPYNRDIEERRAENWLVVPEMIA